MTINEELDKNIKLLEKRYGIGETFDIIGRKILISKKKIAAYLLMIDGFVKDREITSLTDTLQNLLTTNMEDVSKFIEEKIPYVEVLETDDFKVVEDMFLSGSIVVFIDGLSKAIIIDAREFPVRAVAEPELEKVSRGPRDGFIESLISNTALVRRRVKDENLRFNLKMVGRRTKTNVAIAYLDDLVDKELLENIIRKIGDLDLETLPMGEKTLAEQLIPSFFLNPLPKVRFTERPDVVASHLFEGHIIVMVDTSPSAIIIPTTIFHFTQHAEDYYQVPMIGTYIRHIRFAALLISLLLIPTWFLMSLYPPFLPEWLYVVSLKATDHLPIIAQLLILEFSIDLLKISSIHTPNSLGSSFGIIGGLILGNYAIEAGLFTGEAILITAITAISTFATPSIEFSHAIRIFRLFLLVATAIFRLPGFIISLLIILIMIATTKNGSKVRYTYPLFPFNWAHLKHILFRLQIPKPKD